jgi:carbon monoxide dehydrogenase subunit G
VNLQGERAFAAPRATVWRVLNDPASMARTMPGVESFDIHDERRWTANVKIPLGLGGLKMKVDMEKTEEREPDFAKLAIKGQGVGAMLNMQTSFDLSDGPAGGTAMKWSADVRIAGPVGSMGQRVLQPIVNQQVQHVLTALEEQVREALAPTGATRAGDAAGASPAPSTEVAPAAQGPLDHGPPAEATPEPEPESGSSAAEEGVSPWSPEQFEREPEGPTTSTDD